MSTLYRITSPAFEPGATPTYPNVIIDINDNDAPVPPTTGPVVPPHGVTFYVLSGTNHISFYYSALPFFYVGLVFTVSGTVSNNGTFTVLSIQNTSPFAEVIVSETVVNEYVLDPTFTPDVTIVSSIVNLIGSGEPIKLSVIDNAEEPFTIIKAIQAIIQFNSTINVNMSTFASGSDQRWGVVAYVNTQDQVIFRGFLILDDLSEAFMPTPNIVTLTANDGLGLLKDIPLTDFMTINPSGYNRVMDYIAWCLNKTGLALQINVAMNIRYRQPSFTSITNFVTSPNQFLTSTTNFFYPGQVIVISGTGSNNGTFHVTGVGVGIVAIVQVSETLTAEASALATFTDATTATNFFDIIYLNAKTFEDQISTCINCYDALRVMLLGCYLFQRSGMWYIIRIDEIETATRGLFISTFDSLGKFIANIGQKHYEKDIGKDSPFTIFFSKEATNVVPTRPNKSANLTFDYNLPQEIVCNIDFGRGALTDDISSTEKHYDIECWAKLFSNTSSDDPATTPIYIKILFVNDRETERYVVIEKDATGDYNFIESERIPVGIKDKFIIGISRRLSADITGSGFFRDQCVQVRLYGDDGTFWTCEGKTSAAPAPVWVACDSTFRTNQKGFVIEGNLSQDFTEAQSLFSGDSAEIPVSGYLTILLYQCSFDITIKDTYIDSLSFDYIAFINGSYQKYTSQSLFVQQDGNYKAKQDMTLKISDSPRKLFKGALFVIMGYRQLFNVSTIFGSPNSFEVPGNQVYFFMRYQRLQITGTASNDGFYVVTDVIYHTIGDVTEIKVATALVDETVTCIISEAIFELATNFYNSVLIPNPTIDDFHPYSQIILFDIWNQVKNGRRIFQATCQGLDLSATDSDGLRNNAQLIHKWTLQDIDENTINRIFYLLTFNQDLRICEWTGTLREVDNFTEVKQYTGNSFIYNTK